MELNSPNSNEAVDQLKAVLEEEHRKRVDAENMAKALVEEFSSCNDFDDFRKTFKEKLKDIAPKLMANAVRLATSADSESVQSSMTKWLMEFAITDKLEGSAESELKGLLSKLAKDPTKT